jgi:hypothetical protein
VQEHLRRSVVNLVGVEALKNGYIIGDGRQMRQQFGNFLATAAGAVKSIL